MKCEGTLINGIRLSEDRIINSLLNNYLSNTTLPRNRNFRRAAVLFPFLCIDEERHLLFIRRTTTVKYHKGQVAFPGGVTEEKDFDSEATAKREVYEEIGIKKERIRTLGWINDFQTTTNFIITPIVGCITWPIETKLASREVSKVFTIPLKWLADSTHWREKIYTLSDGRQIQLTFYDQYKSEKVWGVTARIITVLLNVLGLYK